MNNRIRLLLIAVAGLTLSGWALNPSAIADNTWIEILNGLSFSPNQDNWAYEDDLVGDATHGLVWIGPGHRGSPQDAYFYSFDPVTEYWNTPFTAIRPGRDCLTSSSWSVQDSAIIKLGSNNGHQNGIGFFNATYDTIVDKLYTGNHTSVFFSGQNRWVRTRTSGNEIPGSQQHTRGRYDPVHDVLIVHNDGSNTQYTWLYHVQSNTWTSVAPAGGPGSRIKYAATVDERRGLYYMLGGTKGAYCKLDYVNDMWSFNPDSRTWTKFPDFAFAPWETQQSCNDYVTSMAYSAGSDAILYVNRVGETYVFDCSTSTWAKPAISGTHPVIAGRIAYESRSNLFFMVGGSVGDTNDVRIDKGFWTYRYRPVDAAWAARLPAPELSLTLSATAATLSWTAVPGAAGYLVYRFKADPYPRNVVKLTATAITGTGYTDNSATSATAYSYQVCAVTGNGVEGRYSRHLYTRPARPLAVAASVEDTAVVKVSWEASADPGIAGYNVYRARGVQIYGSNFSGYTKLNTAPVNGLEFTDNVDLSDRVARGYIVTAVNVFGCESGLSPITTTFPEPPRWFRVHMKQGSVEYSRFRGPGIPSSIDSTVVRWQPPLRTKILGVNIYRGSLYNTTTAVPFNPAPLTLSDTATTWYTKGTYGSGTFTLRTVNILHQEGYPSDELGPDGYEYTNGESPLLPNTPTPTRVEGGRESHDPVEKLTLMPNPFNPSITLHLSATGINEPGLRMEVYSENGEMVRTIPAAPFSNGGFRFEWNGKDTKNRPAASGLYFFRVKAGQKRFMARAMLMK